MRSRAGGAQDGSARPPFHSHDGLKMTLRALLGSLTIAALASAIASAIAACGSPDARADLPESGRVVDSILPREEAVRRFREGLAPVDSLQGGAGSRDELVAAYVRAIAEADSAAVARLADRAAHYAANP